MTKVDELIGRLRKGVCLIGLHEDNNTELYNIEDADEAMAEAATALADMQAQVAAGEGLADLFYRLCDAYELVCNDTGKNYHQSRGSVYAHARQALAQWGGKHG